MQKELYQTGKEEYAIFTGPADAHFSPLLAGITLPDPTYEIRRTQSVCYVFEYVYDGKGYLDTADGIICVQRGDAYILRAGDRHHYYSDKDAPWNKIWFNVSGSLVRHLLSDYGLDDVSVIPAFGNPSFLEEILATFKKESVSRDHLAILLHRYVQALSAFCGSKKSVSRQALSMKNYIGQNLTTPISIDNIAAYAHLSRSRAIHLFKETYGTTPYHYYQEQRLELAQSLLLRTSLSIQEIADRLGFPDYHHFSGFFKKNCGISPSAYRSSNYIK